ncbi:MAG: hypothetical protein U9N00_05185, partial [Candidatus Bipolaricaulota bacterium]|nr:hypothetical protein [Candidatus Bipolaricaulota bacterium]
MSVAKQDRRSKIIHHEEHEGHEEQKQGKTEFLMHFNILRFRGEVKYFILFLRVLRGKTILY